MINFYKTKLIKNVNYKKFNSYLFKIIKNMGFGDWGLGIGDWGLGIGPNPQYPIPNPQSPNPNPQSPITLKYKTIFKFLLL